MRCKRCGKLSMVIGSQQAVDNKHEQITVCMLCGYISMLKPDDTIICLVGGSGTGKTTLAYTLQQEHGVNVIESYTTRPPRHRDEMGHTFVNQFSDEGEIIAHNIYNGHHYWATADQYRGKGVSIYVIDPPGAKMLKETVSDANIITIGLWCSYKTRELRMLARGNTREEIEERIRYDSEQMRMFPCDYMLSTDCTLGETVEMVEKIFFTQQPNEVCVNH